MKPNWLTNKLGEILVGVIFVIFAVAFFFVREYWISFWSLCLLLILLKIDDLKRFAISPKSGFEAEFQIPPENIERDIEENNRPVTKKTFDAFKEVEEKVLSEIQRKLGGVMKKQINFMYGMPDKPEFIYRPDATIQTENELIFIEVKYVLKPEFAPKIVKNASQYLKTILEKFGPSAGKKLSAKLVLASGYHINLKSFEVPEGIDLEFYKL